MVVPWRLHRECDRIRPSLSGRGRKAKERTEAAKLPPLSTVSLPAAQSAQASVGAMASLLYLPLAQACGKQSTCKTVGYVCNAAFWSVNKYEARRLTAQSVAPEVANTPDSSVCARAHGYATRPRRGAAVVRAGRPGCRRSTSHTDRPTSRRRSRQSTPYSPRRRWPRTARRADESAGAHATADKSGWRGRRGVCMWGVM